MEACCWFAVDCTMLSLCFGVSILLFGEMCRVSANTTSVGTSQSLNNYRLRGDDKDMCYRNAFFKSTVECLEILLESYYSFDIAWTCPHLASVLALDMCEDCPWDRLNSTRMESFNFKRNDAGILFHLPGDSCRIAKHVMVYRWRKGYGYSHWYRVYVPAVFGLLLLLVCPSLLAVDVRGKREPIVLFGRTVSEVMLMFGCWLLFTIGVTLLRVSEDFFYSCDALSGFVLLSVAEHASFMAMLAASFQRYLRLETEYGIQEVRSWSSYMRSNQEAGMIRRRISMAVYYFCCISIVIATALDSGLSFRPGEEKIRNCRIGEPNLGYGVFQYGLLLLELSGLTIYSWGPSRNAEKFWFRYQLLILIAVFSPTMLVVLFTTPVSLSTLIPRVRDKDLASFISPFHAFLVAFLGLLEPLRLRDETGAPLHRPFQATDMLPVQFAYWCMNRHRTDSSNHAG